MRIRNLLLTAVFSLAVIIMCSNCAGYRRATEFTLYNRLGGIYKIAPLVDDFTERLLANPVIGANPNVREAAAQISKEGLKYQLTAFISEKAGGPQNYTGRSMKDSHRHLDITEAQWQAMLEELKKSMAKYNVPPREQEELMALVGITKMDIVTKP